MNWNPLFPHIWDLIYMYIYIYKLPMKFTDRINGKKDIYPSMQNGMHALDRFRSKLNIHDSTIT